MISTNFLDNVHQLAPLKRKAPPLPARPLCLAPSDSATKTTSPSNELITSCSALGLETNYLRSTSLISDLPSLPSAKSPTTTVTTPHFNESATTDSANQNELLAPAGPSALYNEPEILPQSSQNKNCKSKERRN